jgi:hypothetical protein
MVAVSVPQLQRHQLQRSRTRPLSHQSKKKNPTQIAPVETWMPVIVQMAFLILRHASVNFRLEILIAKMMALISTRIGMTLLQAARKKNNLLKSH